MKNKKFQILLMKLKKFSSVLSFVFIFFFSFGCLAQDFYGVYENKMTPYYLSTKKIIVKKSKSKEKLPDILTNSNKIRNFESIPLNEELYSINLNDKVEKQEVRLLLKEIYANENVSFASPYLENEKGEIIAALTNEFIVGLNSETDLHLLEDFCLKNNYIIKKQYDFDARVYFITVERHSDLNAIEASLQAYNTGLFRYAEPNYLIDSIIGTSDPSFNSQWALGNMNVPSAWGLTTGCNLVRVAVLDNGVQLNHPDLMGNLVTGFDATGGGNNGNSTGTGPFDAHGTNCAGIISASANNGIGIAGVAYNSRIIPVKVGSGSFLEFGAMATGIDWLRENNAADIINFSGGTVNVSSQIVTDAINAAAATGRNGLGIIFLSITQNGTLSTVAYPAILENVIAVGSIDSNGVRVLAQIMVQV
ncbi:MAG: S8 family serine peptidase [Saprospiraceae bacterium]